MIFLYQNKTNTISTRFFDRRQRTDTFFLWEITNSVSGETLNFITEDISPSKCSYNLFDLTHSDNGEKENSVNLPFYLEAGHNDYTVYETTEYSLDKDKIIGVIEEDIMFVELIRGVNTPNSKVDNVYY